MVQVSDSLLDLIAQHSTKVTLPHPAFAQSEVDQFIPELAVAMSEAAMKVLRQTFPDRPEVATVGADPALTDIFKDVLATANKASTPLYGGLEAALRLSAGIPTDLAFTSRAELITTIVEQATAGVVTTSDGSITWPGPHQGEPPNLQYDWEFQSDAVDEAEKRVTAIPTCIKALELFSKGPLAGLPSTKDDGALIHMRIQDAYVKKFSWPTSPNPHLVVCERRGFLGSQSFKLLKDAPPNYKAIEVLNTAVKKLKDGAKPSDTNVTYFRPDIADLTTGDFYEIKPIREAVDGYKKLMGTYIGPYNALLPAEGQRGAPPAPVAFPGKNYDGIATGWTMTGSDIKLWLSACHCPGVITYVLMKPPQHRPVADELRRRNDKDDDQHGDPTVIDKIRRTADQPHNDNQEPGAGEKAARVIWNFLKDLLTVLVYAIAIAAFAALVLLLLPEELFAAAAAALVIILATIRNAVAKRLA